ncbi:MAG: winged helix DNA-binding domain-containing protein [Actinomycetota bacterium]|nr:winged helix DNA-binding domain-containing protein [Actinomycetota bacterium]
MLLERADLPLPRAVERMGGLQTQYAPSGYIGLWSRLAGFQRNDLTKALERRSVVTGTLMRVTIHTVSKRDYPLFTEAVRQDRRTWWLNVGRRQAEERRVASAARRVRALLANGPRRRSEIVKELRLDPMMFGGAGLWVDLVRVPPSGTWDRRSADLYGLAETWVGPSEVTREEGLDHLVRRYLGAFGPASRKDIANWAGVALSTLAPALERAKLRRFRDESGGELLDLPGGPLPDPETPAPVRFLPTWDATLLVHARRTQILPERLRPRIFSAKTPHSLGTVLVDGRVTGTWTQKDGRPNVEAFERLPRETQRALNEETERFAEFLAP